MPHFLIKEFVNWIFVHSVGSEEHFYERFNCSHISDLLILKLYCKRIRAIHCLRILIFISRKTHVMCSPCCGGSLSYSAVWCTEDELILAGVIQVPVCATNNFYIHGPRFSRLTYCVLPHSCLVPIALNLDWFGCSPLHYNPVSAIFAVRRML